MEALLLGLALGGGGGTSQSNYTAQSVGQQQSLESLIGNSINISSPSGGAPALSGGGSSGSAGSSAQAQEVPQSQGIPNGLYTNNDILETNDGGSSPILPIILIGAGAIGILFFVMKGKK